MSTALIVAGAMAAALLCLLVFCFNRLVRLRNRAIGAWHGLEAELSRRFSLLPDLAEAARAYARHEAETLEASLREYPAEGGPLDPEQAAHFYPLVESGISALLMRVEGYPELKADRLFHGLAEELSHTESVVANARKYYNACVMHYDNARQGFPCLLVARCFPRAFRDLPYLRLFGEGEVPQE